MNHVSTAPNDGNANERQLNATQRRLFGAKVLSIDVPKGERSSRRAAWRWLSIGIIAAFWLAQFAAYSVYYVLNNPALAADLLLPRALIAMAGLALSLGIFAIQLMLQRRPLSLRAVVALVLAVAATGVHLLIARLISTTLVPQVVDSGFLWSAFFSDLIDRLWVFGSISGIILALSYSADVGEREERISALQSLAHAAQLRALRNQLNPHFLFNALNSVAGLMSRNRIAEAETMIENLGDFLRATLALDPQKLITLTEELRLEQLYLDIEKVRFPDRLNVTLDIPEELKGVLVPSLITQPLIENSMKYAVACSTERVELRISAGVRSDGRFSLVIEDRGGDADAVESKGANVGIGNVEERLKAHFGDAAAIQCSRTDAGFENLLVIPIRRS